MKMRRKNPQPHLLPLSQQSVDILKEHHGLTDGSEWVFPSFDLSKPLSENAFNSALKKMGYDGDTHTAHGFRSTASSLLHELNFSAEVIETQLAHARPGVAGIYNRSNLLPQRKEMLQAWADYLDQLRNGAKVVPIGSKTTAS
jgi:integrase